MSSAVIVSLRVAVSPERAFAAFTQEITAWWRPNALFQLTSEGDGALRFEGGDGGRLVTTLPSGEEFTIGRIEVWRPGEELRFSWRLASFSPEQETRVVVRFEAMGVETRVTVEHRGWDAIPPAHVARHRFPLGPFQQRLGEHWRVLLAAMAVVVVGPGL